MKFNILFFSLIAVSVVSEKNLQAGLGRGRGYENRINFFPPAPPGSHAFPNAVGLALLSSYYSGDPDERGLTVWPHPESHAGYGALQQNNRVGVVQRMSAPYPQQENPAGNSRCGEICCGVIAVVGALLMGASGVCPTAFVVP